MSLKNKNTTIPKDKSKIKSTRKIKTKLKEKKNRLKKLRCLSRVMHQAEKVKILLIDFLAELDKKIMFTPVFCDK